MNNGINNPKLVGVELLKKTQILFQNKAITTNDKDAITSCIREGMVKGTYYKLNNVLFDVLERTTLPNVVEDMIKITF